MKTRSFVGAALAALFATSALSQVNFVPQTGIVSGYYPKATFSSAFIGLVPVTAATDFLCIAGSATKTVRIQRIDLTGSVATAAVNYPVVLVRRASLDTGGTAATTTANPGVTTQIASMDTGVAANTSASATLISYTANPTINDSAPVYIASDILDLALTTTAGGTRHIVWNFVADVPGNLPPLTLRGAAQQVCVNLQGVTITNAVALNGYIEWTEE